MHHFLLGIYSCGVKSMAHFPQSLTFSNMEMAIVSISGNLELLEENLAPSVEKSALPSDADPSFATAPLR